MDPSRELERSVRKVARAVRQLETQLRRIPLSHLDREKIMSDLTNLNSAVTALQAASSAAVNEITNLNAGSDQAGIDSATSAIQAVTTQLTAAVPPAAPAEPAA